MDGAPRPPRRLPPEVYRRRRIVVVFALVVLVAVGWLVIRALTSGGDAEPAASPSPSATSSPSPSASPSPGESVSAAPAIADCTATEVLVTLGAPAITGDAVTFPVTLANNGGVQCLLDGSGADTALLITSGDTRVWKSTDCEATTSLLGTSWLLQPGAAETVEVTWPRTWSFEGCGSSNDTPQPGYYFAELTVQGIPAERLQFELG